MASKYLGSFGKWDFYIATAIGGKYPDSGAVRMIQEGRYDLIKNKKKTNKNGENEPIDIFCTAIHLDGNSKREVSKFDDLPTTYHIFSVGNQSENKGRLGCSCSYAMESREKEDSDIIGLPHENKVSNGYPGGFDLDPLRERYQYAGVPMTPENTIELFRHFKDPEFVGDKADTFGIYKGGIHEFIIDKKKKGEIPVTKWVFCSKPGYYKNLYRIFGAMLNPLLISGVDHINASPPLELIERKEDDHSKNSGGLSYNAEINGKKHKIDVSYRYPIIISRNGEPLKERWYDFMSQIVDLDMVSDISANDKQLLNHRKQLPWLKSQVAWRIIGDKFLPEYDNAFDKLIRKRLMKNLDALPEYGWGSISSEKDFTDLYSETVDIPTS
jgi:hypothetical protein